MPGDGIGPEITQATQRVLALASERFSLGLAFEPRSIGLEALARTGTTFPGGARSLPAADAILLGPVSHRTTRLACRAASIRPASCASASISTPTSVPPVPRGACPTGGARPWTW